jgi:uncharacterized protein YcbX
LVYFEVQPQIEHKFIKKRFVTIQVSQLFHFPVKSLKGVKPKQMELDGFGPKWDRRFMLVDKTGRFLTQRECPFLPGPTII